MTEITAGDHDAAPKRHPGLRQVTVTFVLEDEQTIHHPGRSKPGGPPGGGNAIVDGRVVIEPLRLAGLDAASARAAIGRQADDLAIAAEALALASAQFSKAVSE